MQDAGGLRPESPGGGGTQTKSRYMSRPIRRTGDIKHDVGSLLGYPP